MLATGHAVAEEDSEPGIPHDEQAHGHELDMVLMSWDLEAQATATEWLGFGVRLPLRLAVMDARFTDGHGQDVAEFESIHHRDEAIYGVGDLGLTARVSLVPAQAGLPWALEVWAGVTLPTGEIQPDPFDLGRQGEQHQHLFFGTGTVNPTLGMDTRLDLGAVVLTGFAGALLPAYHNRFGYRAPQTLGGGLGALSGFGLAEWRFILQQEVFGEWPADWNGQPAENSGRVDLILTTGVFWTPAEGVVLHLLAKLPYFTQAMGGQVTVPFIGVLGVSYTWSAAGHAASE